MPNRLLPSIGLFAFLVFSSAPAFAQQTGSVSGIVVDRSGSPVVGATVTVSGDVLPTSRVVVTGDTGMYSFPALLPGNYTVAVEKTGVGSTTRGARVAVGRDTQTDIILGADVSETVTVTAAMPDIDLKKTELNFNYTREFIQGLPLDRSYLGLLQLAAGVAENNAFAPNGGGSRQDNTYLIDSVNITNPLFGYLSTEVNELDIEELNIKRGAISAEFGRSTGFVSNAVTRSGSNAFSGNYRFEAIPSDWVKESRTGVRSITDRWINAVNVGGPAIENRLFYYASARISRVASTRSANNFGPLPDREEKTNEVFGKITAQIAANHAINAGYRHRPTKVDFAGIGANDSPDVATNFEGTNRVASLSYDWFIGSRTSASVKFVHMTEENETVAIRDLGFQPAFDPANIQAMGQSTQGGITVGAASLRLNQQNYSRDEVKVSVSHLLDFGGTNHNLRAGFGWDRGDEQLTRNSNGWGTIGFVTVSGQQLYNANYYPEQPTQNGIGRTYSIFVQDDISIGSRLVVNAGVLFNKDEFAQEIENLVSTGSTVVTGTFLRFGFGDEAQPRLGVNYQLSKDRGDKVYGNYGRYYALDQKSSARALASGRLFTEDARFTLAGQLVSQVPAANTTAKRIAADLNPPYTDETVVGYATPLRDGWSLDAFFLYRESTDFIEDIPSILPFSTFVYQNDPEAYRKYKTFTVELNRRMRDRWSANVSYAWSKLYGNYDQDYSGGLGGAAVFNTSSLINDGPGTFTVDRYRDGVLSQDRTNVFKVLATWMPAFVENLSVGTFIRTQSGTPWSALGLSRGSGFTYLNYLEQAGANRNPVWTNVDLLLRYDVQLGGARRIGFEGRLMNVFNTETVLLVDQRQYLNGRNLTFPAPADRTCLSCWTDSWTSVQYLNPQPNPNFGKPTAYATPTRFLLSVLFSF